MTIDLDDPIMDGYVPIEEIIEDEGGIADGKVAEEIQFSTLALSFADTGAEYESPSLVVVLTNTGYDEVNIYGHTLTGEFVLKSDMPDKVLPSETVAIQIAFAPLTIGAKTGSLYVDTGDAAGDEYVELTGTGIPPGLLPENIIDGGEYGTGV